MSYWSVQSMTTDADLLARLTAAAAQQHAPGNPQMWAEEHRYELCSAPGWDAAWDSALAAEVEQPGRDEAVISDPMILAQVQAVLGAG